MSDHPDDAAYWKALALEWKARAGKAEEYFRELETVKSKLDTWMNEAFDWKVRAEKAEAEVADWAENAMNEDEDLQARAEKAEALVERAFRDGIAYATNVNVKDANLAWEHSQVRAALKEQGQ